MVNFFRLGMVLLIITVLVSGVVVQSEEDIPQNAMLAFMIGEWEVVSERNEQAYLTTTVGLESEWISTTGYAIITSELYDHTLLERYISVNDEMIYEQTFFLGTRDNGQAWDAANSDNLINEIVTLTGEFSDNQLVLTHNRRPTDTRWRIRINQISDDQFERHLFLAQQDGSEELIWNKQYTRIADGAYDEKAEEIREMYTAPQPLAEMSDFHFWLGHWQVDHPTLDDVVDHVFLTNSGHTMLEFWTARAIDNPSAFFTMTIWDEAAGSYYNWFWGRTSTTRVYTGGTCQGEGEDKECRLAGRFYNITPTSIDWTLGSNTWIFNRIDAP